MKKYKLQILLAGLILLAGCRHSTTESDPHDYNSFREGFINPPLTAQPKVYWWWLNGYTDTTRMKEELRAIKDAGIGGVDIFEIGVPFYTNPGGMIPAGPAFMSELSQQHIRFAIQEAGRLGLDVGFNLASSWNAGGTWTKPEHAAKSLYRSTINIQGPGRQTFPLPFPAIPRTDSRNRPLLISFQEDGRPAYYEDVAVLAIPASADQQPGDTTGIIDVTKFFDRERETFTWDAPPGSWTITRYVCANSGEALKLPSPHSQAPIIDHYDSSATRAHFMYFINELKPLLGDFGKTRLKNFYLASYEATGSVWTPTLPEAFKMINGYELYKLIPAIFDKGYFNQALGAKFESDFERTLSHLIVNNHYRKAREISNRYGLKITSEAGGPGKPLHNVPVDALAALGSLDVPRGEFWNKHHFYDKDSIDILWLVKEIAAASNIYQRNIVEEEAFTSFQHWQEGPCDLKPLADRAFCEGMNRVVIHGFTHNPAGTGYPGIVYHAGTHFNDKRIWWPKIRPFTEYLARISYILQEADFSADVVHYYGDRIPKFVYPKNTKYTVGHGFDYEMINTEVLLKDLYTEGGKLKLPGGSEFRMLSLENESEIHPEVLKKLQQLVMDGAVIIGEKPVSVRSPVSEEMTGILEDLWTQSDQPGQGRIISGKTPASMLAALGVAPDLSYQGQESSLLDYVHYKKQDLDFYLIRNTTDAWVARNIRFRQTDRVAELWDPVSGTILPAPIYTQHDNQTRIPITLAPYASVFVVFRDGAGHAIYTSVTAAGENPPLMSYTKDGIVFLEEGKFDLHAGTESRSIENKISVHEIAGPWKVHFSKSWGAPESETFDSLVSWTASATDGIKYYSGIGTYEKIFSYPIAKQTTEKVYLDLGELQKVGDVWLNERHLQIVWTKPWRLDITDVVKTGKNTLRIEVANTWSNRLTGDALKGENFTRTNIADHQRVPWAKMPLLQSGLLGPVTIQVFTPVK